MIQTIYRYQSALRIILLIVIVASLMSFVLPVGHAQADPVLDNLGKAGKGMGATNNDGAPKQDLPTMIGSVIKVVLGILGVIFLILVIYAGIKWMTAGGEAEDVKKAKDILRQAIFGLAITLAAYAITFFVVDRLTTAITG